MNEDKEQKKSICSLFIELVCQFVSIKEHVPFLCKKKKIIY